MCGMTPHIVFDQLQAEAAVPLLSMVQTSVTAAQAQKFTKLGLFGTKFTMSHDFATKPFETQGITMCLPNQADQATSMRRSKRNWKMASSNQPPNSNC